MKGAKKGEFKGGVQKVECKRGECRGGSAERQASAYLNTLVCLRPRADLIAYAHSAGPGMIRKWLDELFGSGLCVRCFVGLSISFLDSFSMHFSIIPKPITKQFLKPFSYYPWRG